MCIRVLLEHNGHTLCKGKEAWAFEISLLTDLVYHPEQRKGIQIRARRCIMSGGKEIYLLTSFFGKRLEMYKVGFFAYAIESYDGPLRWRLPICKSVFDSTRIKSSDIVLCQRSGSSSLE
jgi:hypothetical protein